MNLNEGLSDAAQVHRLRDFQSDLERRQPFIQRDGFNYGKKRKDHQLSRVQSPSQLLPKLPHSPGLDDIISISPQANLRSSRYAVIPPLTPPDDRNPPRQPVSPPYFQHNSYDPLDDPYGRSSEAFRMKQRQHNRPSFDEDQRLETFRYLEARNPLHDLLDNGPLHHSSPVASHHRAAQAKLFELCTREAAVVILDETTDEMILSLAQDVSVMGHKRLWEIYSEDARYYHPCLTSLQDDVLNEELRVIVKEVINEMVTDYFKSKTTKNESSDEKEEITDLLPENQVTDIVTEVVHSDVAKEVYNDTLSATVASVVQELMRSEGIQEAAFESQISELTTDMMIDGLQLDHLLMKLANHRQVWNDSEVKDMLLDSILASEFTQLFHLMSTEGQRTCDVLPLKRFHENTTTDYAVDFLLNELTATLDEDLDDLLEYEHAQEMTARKLVSQTR